MPDASFVLPTTLGSTCILYIIHQSLSDHPLLEKAGFDIESRANKMLLPTTEGSKYTTTNRTVHQGRHLNKVKLGIEERMRRVVDRGELEGYTQQQYREKLDIIVSEERSLLKSGDTILNKAKDHRKLKSEE